MERPVFWIRWKSCRCSPTAGAVGGFAASLIRVPTEVVKQRMQTGQVRSAPDAVRLIVGKEGFEGLNAGYGSFLLRDLPFDAIQFCIYEQLRIGYKLVAKRELNDPENALIGAFARTTKFLSLERLVTEHFLGAQHISGVILMECENPNTKKPAGMPSNVL